MGLQRRRRGLLGFGGLVVDGMVAVVMSDLILGPVKVLEVEVEPLDDPMNFLGQMLAFSSSA